MNNLISYRGYRISIHGAIFKKGRPVFDAPWLYCRNEEEAKRMIDMSYEKQEEQTQKKIQQHREMINTEGDYMEQESEIFERWTQEQAELQLMQNEY